MTLDVTQERQRVRVATLAGSVLALIVGATLLALALWFGGLAFIGIGILLAGIALRMYAELHEEETARIAHGRARAAFADPYPVKSTERTAPTREDA